MVMSNYLFQVAITINKRFIPANELSYRTPKNDFLSFYTI